jgi:TolB-like protein/DNA-binding winged helix-turn-helix (wHTH) protein
LIFASAGVGIGVLRRNLGSGKLLYSFENYSLDTDRRELHCGTVLIGVEPQVFDLLVHLIRNRERVVSRDDLFDSIWSGRIVSESALSTRINAARRAIGDSGAEQRLIKTLPRKGVRFLGAVREGREIGERRNRPLAGEASTVRCEPADPGETVEGPSAVLRCPLTRQQMNGKICLEPALPDTPSIAVMPFNNLSGDPHQECFAAGVVEEIITALSRIPWLLVVARNFSFTYKGRPVDMRQVGRELGARYLIEGGVRKAASRVRITVQLVDALAGAHLWAGRFEGALDDNFDLQDQVTASIVGAIAPKLEQVEIERAKRKPAESLGAYDHYLRGIASLNASLNRRTRDGAKDALRFFYKAIDLDPDFSSAYGMAALCYVARRGNHWTTDVAKETSEATQLARRAVELGKEDAIALAAGGHALAYFASDFESGSSFIDRARALNPNLARVWRWSGCERVLLGESEAALEYLACAMRLSPFDPSMYSMQAMAAYAHFFAGRYDEASSWAEQALRENPNYHPALRTVAAGNALAGRLENARKAMARLREFDPALRVSNLGDLTPFRRPEDVARHEEGLRRAGLPE